jgi:hypothetical protein
MSDEDKALAMLSTLPIAYSYFCGNPDEKFLETSSTDRSYTADIE